MNDLIKTPCFVINQQQLDENIDGLKSALSLWGGKEQGILGYSVKTNSLPWLLEYVKEKGCYAEVVSDTEFKLARKMGYPEKYLIFNGPIKSKEYFYNALEKGSIVNIDSKREVQWLEEKYHNEHNCKIGIRVNFNIEEKCPMEIGYEEDGTRFGFNYENGDLKNVIEKIRKLYNVQIVGIHMHVTSITRSLNVYQTLAEMACKIKDEFDLDLEYIDLGGGFFGGVENKPTFEDYINIITNQLQKSFNPQKTKLILEPGSAIIGSPVSFIANVIDVKNNHKTRIVTTDASRMNIDPLMIKKRQMYSLISEHQKKIEKQVVCGFTCMDRDRIMVLKNEIELSVGNQIIFEKVGAYTMALNPLFINYFPCVYLLKKNGEYQLIRKKWEVEDVL